MSKVKLAEGPFVCSLGSAGKPFVNDESARGLFFDVANILLESHSLI